MSKPNIGDEIIVKVGGKEYKAVIDKHRMPRFVPNPLFCHLVDSKMVNLTQLSIDYQMGKFPQEEYMLFTMGLGYSVPGFAERFEDVEIENPLDD